MVIKFEEFVYFHWMIIAGQTGIIQTVIPFQYDPEIIKVFPRLAGGAILGSGLKNGPSPETLRQAYLSEQRQTLERIGSTPLSEIEALAGWRAAFRLFGVDPTQYRSAAEALLRRLTKKGDIPSINAVVDMLQPGEHPLCAAGSRVRPASAQRDGDSAICERG